MYTQRVESANPSCVIFLVDQSASMKDPIAGTTMSKSEFVAEQLNATLAEMIIHCSKEIGQLPKPYFAVAVIGYGTDPVGRARVQSAVSLPGQEGNLAWTTDLAQHPLRVEERTRDDAGETISFNAPVWIEPEHEGGTPMCAAMDRAGKIAHTWIQSYPNSFPPIVLNLTDGESTDGDPKPWADRLRNLQSNDGRLLLFNVMMATGKAAQPTMFPSRREQLANGVAQKMFDMSSELPEMMRVHASRQGYAVDPGARGMSMNADFKAVMTFLDVGTSVRKNLR